MSPISKVSRIDVTRAADAARHLYIATSIIGVISPVLIIWGAGGGQIPPFVIVGLICALIYALVYARRLNTRGYAVFIAACVLTTVIFATMNYLSEPSFLFALISLLLNPLLWPFWAFVPLSVVSAARLWWVKYPSIEIGPLGLADAVTHHAKRSPSGLSDFHWPSNARMTSVYALLFVFSIFVILFLVYSAPKNTVVTVLWSIWIPIFLAVRLRKYYALPADRVLELDKRQPVLFLRSFADDAMRLWGKGVVGKYRGRTIEEAISPLAKIIGPFVGIADPKSRLPLLGAAKTFYSDDTWQTAIARWIDMAQMIVMVAGRTEGIGWEIEHISERAAFTKLVILMPPRARSDPEEARNWLHGHFSSSPYAQAVAHIDTQRSIALIFSESDLVVIETSKIRNSEVDYFIAFQAAICLGPLYRAWRQRQAESGGLLEPTVDH